MEKGVKSRNAWHGFISGLFGYLVVKDFLSNIQSANEFWYIPGIIWIVINKHHVNLKNILNTEAEKLRDPDWLELAEEQINDIFSIIEMNL